MSIDRIVFAFIGAMITFSLILAWFVSPNWLILTAALGLHLLQMSITGFCPLAMILKKLGVAPGPAFT